MSKAIVKGTIEVEIPDDFQTSLKTLDTTATMSYTGSFRLGEKIEFKITYEAGEGGGTEDIVGCFKAVQVATKQRIDFQVTKMTSTCIEGTYSSSGPRDYGSFKLVPVA